MMLGCQARDDEVHVKQICCTYIGRRSSIGDSECLHKREEWMAGDAKEARQWKKRVSVQRRPITYTCLLRTQKLLSGLTEKGRLRQK